MRECLGWEQSAASLRALDASPPASGTPQYRSFMTRKIFMARRISLQQGMSASSTIYVATSSWFLEDSVNIHRAATVKNTC
ncbi:uncharacterized protein LOC107516391 isoform X3 [Rousettus aegyptiacus]|uniref:uncharacterized protein LOC107516391 isoform X3 n=1 Tax=Rousettus aegyptiacus TaxID=9407 RepID=UPI00168D755F|nr:uncharacterized protein LOC107516391 isoform X3 [Rousettus aegyptiacus]